MNIVLNERLAFLSYLCISGLLHYMYFYFYLFFYLLIFFTQDSEDGSSAKRHHHVLFSAGNGTGGKRSRFSGADGVLNQNGPEWPDQK